MINYFLQLIVIKEKKSEMEIGTFLFTYRSQELFWKDYHSIEGLFLIQMLQQQRKQVPRVRLKYVMNIKFIKPEKIYEISVLSLYSYSIKYTVRISCI